MKIKNIFCVINIQKMLGVASLGAFALAGCVVQPAGGEAYVEPAAVVVGPPAVYVAPAPVIVGPEVVVPVEIGGGGRDRR
jgi:hypothetical protein